MGSHSVAGREAWSRSRFSRLSVDATTELLESAIELDLPGGELIPDLFRDRPDVARIGRPGLVIDGLLRIFVTSSDRQVTVQYAGADDAFGIPALGPKTGVADMVSQAQTLTDSRVLLLSPVTVADLVSRDLTVAAVTIDGLRHALYTTLSVAAESALWPLRRRVARHLLDLAHRDGHEAVVTATVQDIADATGTVREVVTRLFKDMRQAGLIDREGGRLVLRDLRALHLVAQGEPLPTQPDR